MAVAVRLGAGSWLGLPLATEGQRAGGHRTGRRDDGRSPGARRYRTLPTRGETVHAGRHDSPRHPPRGRASGALDYRHGLHAVAGGGAGLRRALGY